MGLASAIKTNHSLTRLDTSYSVCLVQRHGMTVAPQVYDDDQSRLIGEILSICERNAQASKDDSEVTLVSASADTPISSPHPTKRPELTRTLSSGEVEKLLLEGEQQLHDFTRANSNSSESSDTVYVRSGAIAH